MDLIMMFNKKYNLITTISLFLFGLVFFLGKIGVELWKDNLLLIFPLMLWGVVSAFFAFEDNRKDILVISSTVFFTGIFLFVNNNHEILNVREAIVISIFFVFAGVMLVLYINDLHQTVFLYFALVSILLGYFSLTIFKEYGLFRYVNIVADMFEIFWPVFLMLLGIILFIRRKK
jgi:hypothetical protein